MYVHVGVRVFARVSVSDIHTGSISLLVSLPAFMFAPKLKSHAAVQGRTVFL